MSSEKRSQINVTRRVSALLSLVLICEFAICSSQTAWANADQIGPVRYGTFQQAAQGYTGCLSIERVYNAYCLVIYEGSGTQQGKTIGYARRSVGGQTVDDEVIQDGALQTTFDDMGWPTSTISLTFPILGKLDLVVTTDVGPGKRSTNAGCLAYPVQYVLTADAGPSIWSVLENRGTFGNDEVFRGAHDYCNEFFVASTSGTWALL